MSDDAQTGPLLEVKNVKKAFGHVQALNGVSFTIGQASVVALLGDNGAGKSSLISLLNGLYTPDSGEIMWQGQAVRLSSPRTRRSSRDRDSVPGSCDGR